MNIVSSIVQCCFHQRNYNKLLYPFCSGDTAKVYTLHDETWTIGEGPVIIYGWGWARRENISKQKNFFTQPFTKQKYLQPILLDNIAC